jgi:Holliday junction resolvase
VLAQFNASLSDLSLLKRIRPANAAEALRDVLEPGRHIYHMTHDDPEPPNSLTALPIILMQTYRKGYRSERELLRILSSRGYSCIRSASSGGFHTAVDVVALKEGRILCFEIKSWARMPRLDRTQLSHFAEWTRNAHGLGFLAWYNRNEWKFLPLKDVLSGDYSEGNWIKLGDFLRVFT